MRNLLLSLCLDLPISNMEITGLLWGSQKLIRVKGLACHSYMPLILSALAFIHSHSGISAPGPLFWEVLPPTSNPRLVGALPVLPQSLSLRLLHGSDLTVITAGLLVRVLCRTASSMRAGRPQTLHLTEGGGNLLVRSSERQTRR